MVGGSEDVTEDVTEGVARLAIPVQPLTSKTNASSAATRLTRPLRILWILLSSVAKIPHSSQREMALPRVAAAASGIS
jgi:hypothetical protein